ncbi:MAG: hypothetical protein AVDCRST_MAG06-3199, partial [uncultured Nocardioides sp.]
GHHDERAPGHRGSGARLRPFASRSGRPCGSRAAGRGVPVGRPPPRHRGLRRDLHHARWWGARGARRRAGCAVGGGVLHRRARRCPRYLHAGGEAAHRPGPRVAPPVAPAVAPGPGRRAARLEGEAGGGDHHPRRPLPRSGRVRGSAAGPVRAPHLHHHRGPARRCRDRPVPPHPRSTGGGPWCRLPACDDRGSAGVLHRHHARHRGARPRRRPRPLRRRHPRCGDVEGAGIGRIVGRPPRRSRGRDGAVPAQPRPPPPAVALQARGAGRPRGRA